MNVFDALPPLLRTIARSGCKNFGIKTLESRPWNQVHDIKNFESPKLGIRFEMTKPEMTVYGPDGLRFVTLGEQKQIAVDANQRAVDANQRAARLAELGRKARRGQATPDEVAELERLEDESTRVPPTS